jgi:asparagine synthase (glutamine-hydrolysing)
MCGIAGRFSPEGLLTVEDRLEVQAMTDHIRHRGPDAGGLLDRCPIGVLGSRRLAIIDVKHGHQPMSSADGTIWITYNGEVYNFRVLRAELEGRGHRFQTSSDTEVVLEAYREWGEACVERLEGMFGFAILDLGRRSLLLARDHIGKKPLYFRWRKGRLDFASELGALALASDWHDDLDPLAWSFYLRLGYIPSPWTIYRGVEKLRAGEVCIVDEKGVRRRKYWTAGPNGEGPAADRALEAVDEALQRAVDERLVSEVPLGAFLSGGIDSGLVVSLMSRTLGAGVKTTSVGFAGDPTGGELEAARAVARHNQTDHAEFMVEPDAASILGDMMRHFGEPFADSSAVPTWYISRETRRRVTVALSGDGGDETHAGYDFRYLPHSRDARLRHAIPGVLRAPVFSRLALAWPARHSLPRFLRLQTLFRNLAVEEDEAFYLDLCFTKPPAAALLSPDLARHESEVEEFVRGVYRDCRNDSQDPLQAIMLADARLYLPEDVLVKVDRMSMAHSLEVRSPLLSKNMVELAFTIPSDLKVEGETSKVVLRRLAARYLPPQILALPKQGFHLPLDQWLRTSLSEPFETAVLGDGADLGWFDRQAVRRLWGEHRSGRFHHGATLWAVWSFVEWLRGRAPRPSRRPIEHETEPRQQSA